jgi:hypothetical protein
MTEHGSQYYSHQTEELFPRKLSKSGHYSN